MWPFYLFFPLSIFNWSIIVLQYCVCFCHTSTWINHRYKKLLLLGRKAMANLDSIFKSRDITLLTKVCIAKAVVFPVVMYGCEIWTIKQAECIRIAAFELWCWRRVLRKRRWSNQSILKGNQPWILFGRTDAEAEAPILQPPDVKSQLIVKDPEAGKDWRQKKGAAEDTAK